MSRERYDLTAWNQARGRVAELAGKTVRVGIVGPSGALVDENGTSIADIARIHEYGAPGANIPERSFIRRTFLTRRADLQALLARYAKAVLLGTMTPMQALGLIGEQCVAWVKATIRATIPPPLAPETIEAKGSSKPLIDDGQLINSITYEIVDVPVEAEA